MKFALLFFVLIGQLCLAQSGDDKTKPTTIILIRHASRGNDGTNDPPLSEEGTQRVKRLMETMTNTKLTAIYSTDYKRTRNTVEPLAKSKGLEVKLYEAMKEEEIKQIIAANSGGTILICGHSNTTPWTANFLTGEKLENFKDTEYGNILIVTFLDFGKATLTRLNY